ncbi:TetR/AcrR family transcriptional regulator [Kordiimonas aquimaris]|uniref:TetR/AcrR family transcriptional regulator n=1 Tax=Kordiimonas aquimaris TaxID=707591 RepID=UPI0021CDF717|nr:TetR/AcrR family transcriptional regulator [Kordiimonas aquimaris]
MARPAKHRRDILLEKLSGIFRLYGYDGASMSVLSSASGLSKASLYHHFPGGKQEMAEKVLGEEGKRLQRLVLEPFDAHLRASNALINSLQGVGQFYDGDQPSCLMNSVMHGTGVALFGQGIESVVSAWLRRYADAYTEICGDRLEGDEWAAYALERIQGALILSRVKSERKFLMRCLDELQGDVAIVAAA